MSNIKVDKNVSIKAIDKHKKKQSKLNKQIRNKKYVYDVMKRDLIELRDTESLSLTFKSSISSIAKKLRLKAMYLN